MNGNREINRIIRFIREKKGELNKAGGLVPLSGGLDSAVTAALAVKALGPERVILINLYEHDSKKIHIEHAKRFAETLGCDLVQRNISGILKAAGTYSILPIHWIPSRAMRGKLVEFARDKILGRKQASLLSTRLTAEAESWEAKANAYAMAKHRMRMVLVFQYAEIHNLMVIGAANRTEWLTGTFSKFGVDHNADIMPILHLYRSEMEEIGKAHGILEYILTKAADPDILPGLGDKQELLGDFKSVDRILMRLEQGEDLVKAGFDQALVSKIIELKSLSDPMRKSPYQLERG